MNFRPEGMSDDEFERIQNMDAAINAGYTPPGMSHLEATLWREYNTLTSLGRYREAGILIKLITNLRTKVETPGYIDLVDGVNKAMETGPHLIIKWGHDSEPEVKRTYTLEEILNELNP
jgi:hypothetical protein